VTDELRFAKYEGTGNDFVMIADLDDERTFGEEVVAALCDRRTGVGADGLIRVVRSN
jgi:diaminopimelate epimerase